MIPAFLVPHGHSRPQSEGVEQAVGVYFSYLHGNMHGQMPNKHKQQHHVHGIQCYVDLFECHNVMPVTPNFPSLLGDKNPASTREELHEWIMQV